MGCGDFNEMIGYRQNTPSNTHYGTDTHYIHCTQILTLQAFMYVRWSRAAQNPIVSHQFEFGVRTDLILIYNELFSKSLIAYTKI